MKVTTQACVAVLVVVLWLLGVAHGSDVVVRRFWANDRQSSYLTQLARVLPGEQDAKLDIWLLNKGASSWPEGIHLRLLPESYGWTSSSSSGIFDSTEMGETQPGQDKHFSGRVNAPDLTGVFTLEFGFFDKDDQPLNGVSAASVLLEVSCDDGVFCNGPELFVKGQCMATNTNPCGIDDPHGCATVICSEEGRTCNYELAEGCETCAGCVPDCSLPNGGKET